MNFTGIPNQKPIGRLLRAPLRCIPKKAVLPILQGRLAGTRWVVGSSNHGCWLGSYEYEKRRLFEKTITPGSVVYDIGAHAGFYTLLASVLVGPPGSVIAFEPSPRNLAYLRSHLRRNGVVNATVIEAAVSDRVGMTQFDEGAGECKLMGHLSAEGALKVRTVSLDEQVDSGAIPSPDYIKIDVEGSELLVLGGATHLLAQAPPTIFLATHAPSLRRDCCQLLDSHGYQIERIGLSQFDTLDELLARPK